MNSSESVTTFERAIAPIGWSAFLAEYWNKTFLHLPGYAGKFGSLLRWAELNDILEQHRLDEHRLVLSCDGQRVGPERYLATEGNRLRLDTAALASLLGQGSTLVLNAVDEMAPAVRTFAESLDRLLDSGTETKVNLYASWRTQRCFDLHWDHQEINIVQVAGRKHWKVYRPTRPSPLRSSHPAPPLPVDTPVWEGTLEEGDMLYLPRGWWHIAHPLDAASLHLTVTTVPARGHDLLKWLGEQLLQVPDVRKDVPLRAVDDEQEYLSRLRTILTKALSDRVLDRFRAARDARILPRPHLRLPHVPPPTRLQLTMDTQVKLTRGRRLAIDLPLAGQPASFRADAYRWECAPDVVPALESLCDAPSSIGALCSRLTGPPTIARFKILLGAMVLKGVVSTISTTEPGG
jgi:ribosomal protein L16 Arg81 hydroxylase